MATSGSPFEGISDMMVQGFEQTRKAMDNYFDFFEKSIKASPTWLNDADLSKKMKSYTDQHVAAASEYAEKLTRAKDFPDFLRMQSEFMQAQWKAFSEQAKGFGEAVTKSATSAFKGST